MARGRDRFLEPGDFHGRPILRGGDAERGIQATYEGYLAFANLRRQIVAPLLPPGHRLASNSELPTRHPVLLMMGRPHDGAFFKPGSVDYTYVAYHETALLIPFVQRQGGSRWRTWVVRMYLDNRFATNQGNLNYGYRKLLAVLDLDPRRVAVRRQQRRLFEAATRTTGRWHPAREALKKVPSFAAMLDIVACQVLGIRLGHFETCSFFEWDLAGAQAAPAATRFRFLAPFRAGMEPWVDLGELGNAPRGAVAIRGVRWRIQYPNWTTCS